MTLPSLVQKYKEKETVSRLKKVYATLENAFRLAQNEHTEVTNWFGEDDTKDVKAKIFFNNLKPYLKISKECGFEEGCLKPGVAVQLDGRNYTVDYNSNTSEYKVVLADGTPLVFYIAEDICTLADISCGNIKVGIDGIQKGNYVFGKDFFVFSITPRGIVPNGLQDSSRPFEEYCNKTKDVTANGIGCAAWVIYNENMDYLHCDDLSWNGKKKCN